MHQARIKSANGKTEFQTLRGSCEANNPARLQGQQIMTSCATL